MIRYCRQDFEQNESNTKGKFIALMFRIASLAKKNKIIYFFLLPYLLLYKLLIEWVMGIEIPWFTEVGPGLQVYHGYALVVNKDTIIGSNCVLRQSTTIGNAKQGGGSPIIGDNVDIGANTCIIGNISIGNGVIIGAGTVVVNSVPDNSIIVGNPGRIIRIRNTTPTL